MNGFKQGRVEAGISGMRLLQLLVQEMMVDIKAYVCQKARTEMSITALS